MRIVYEKNGIHVTGEVFPDEIWPLDSVLHHSGFILEVIKPEILEDIEKGEFTEYTYITAGIKVEDKNYFLLFDPYEFYDEPCTDKEETYVKVPQEPFWKLLEEYDKVERTDWKKIEITFDGKEFDLKVEY